MAGLMVDRAAGSGEGRSAAPTLRGGGSCTSPRRQETPGQVPPPGPALPGHAGKRSSGKGRAGRRRRKGERKGGEGRKEEREREGGRLRGSQSAPGLPAGRRLEAAARWEKGGVEVSYGRAAAPGGERGGRGRGRWLSLCGRGRVNSSRLGGAGVPHSPALGAPCQRPEAARVSCGSRLSLGSRLVPPAAGSGHAGLPVGSVNRAIGALCALWPSCARSSGGNFPLCQAVCDGAGPGTSAGVERHPWCLSLAPPQMGASCRFPGCACEREEHPKLRASPSSSKTLDLAPRPRRVSQTDPRELPLPLPWSHSQCTPASRGGNGL